MEYDESYNAIGATIAQIKQLNFTPNVVWMGRIDYKRFRQGIKNINLTLRLYALARKAHRN